MFDETKADRARWAAEAVRALHTALARATDVNRLMAAGQAAEAAGEAICQAIECASIGLDHLRAIGQSAQRRCPICADRGTFDDHVCSCAAGKPYLRQDRDQREQLDQEQILFPWLDAEV